MSLHSFDPSVAAKVGVNAAVIYQNILFWTRKNAANNRHVHDGYVWTYNSVKALNDLFDYLTPSQIRTAIGKLLDAGLIAEGNYNKSAYDRTKWYGVSSQVHLRKTANGFDEKREPIPDSKPDSKPDTPPNPPQGADDGFDDFWQEVPKKVGKGQARKAYRLALKKTDRQTIAKGMRAYAESVRGKDPQYVAHPSTWLNGERWADEQPQDKRTFRDKCQSEWTDKDRKQAALQWM